MYLLVHKSKLQAVKKTQGLMAYHVSSGRGYEVHYQSWERERAFDVAARLQDALGLKRLPRLIQH